MDILGSIEEMIGAGRLNAAHEKLDGVQNESPGNGEVYFLFGLLYFKRDQFDDAVSSLQKALKINDRDYRYHELLGQALGLKAQLSGAVKGALLLPKIKSAFLKAIDLNPQAIKAKEGLFVYYLFTPAVAGGDEKKAVQLIDELMQENPAHAQMLQAMLHAKNDDATASEEAIDKALQLAPEDEELLFKGARFYLGQGNIEKALATIDTYLKLKPNDPLAFDVKADCFCEQKEFSFAIECYQKALEINKGFYPARRKLAQCMLKAGDTGSAQTEFEYLLKKHPKTPAAHIAKQALKQISA